MENLDAKVKQVDVLPMVKHYISELGLHDLFDKYVPNKNGSEICPAQILSVMLMNITVASKPLYHVDDWLCDYFDGKTDDMIEASKYNDDRLARCLDNLFSSDRHSLMTEASVAAIKLHDLETKRIHNDSTSISFAGAYNAQSPDAVQLKIGHNKDNRPGWKQVVFGLNITEDGHVPLTFQLYNGNKADVATHMTNWDGLRNFLESEDFVYTADTKLCSVENLHHIEKNDGKFVTIMPKNRNEVKEFRQRIHDGEIIEWQSCYSIEHSRKKGTITTYQSYDEEKSWEGYRIVWVHSSSKEVQDKKTRDRQIFKAEEALEEISAGLNKYYLKTEEQIKQAVEKACKGVADLVKVEVIEKKTIEKVKIGPGRHGKNSKYENREHVIYHLECYRDEEAIKKAAKTDGIFPLTTNTSLSAEEVLRIYKKQPFLEKRFYTTKSILDVAPVFLKKNRRIEAMLFLYFIALMLVSLIERNIRREMEQQQVESLPIIASKMNTKKPTWNNIRFFFRKIHLLLITKGEHVLQSSVKGVTARHRLVLKLLKIPNSVYDSLQNGWWNFEFQQ